MGNLEGDLRFITAHVCEIETETFMYIPTRRNRGAEVRVIPLPMIHL